jgi:hypothetical protein
LTASGSGALQTHHLGIVFGQRRNHLHVGKAGL